MGGGGAFDISGFGEVIGGMITDGFSELTGNLELGVILALVVTKGKAQMFLGSLCETKKALTEVKKMLGGLSLPKGKQGKFGSPQRGDSKKGYRLDPSHPNTKPGSGEEYPHINWWDYSKGKWR